MGSFDFWQKWLFGFGLYLVVFGLVLAIFGHSALMDRVLNAHIDPVFWGAEPLPESAERFQAWVYGVLGSVVAGWGMFVSFIAHYPFKARERWAWNCIAAVFATWFVVDTTISIYWSVDVNVLINLVFLAFVSLPLGFTRRHFAGASVAPENR